MLSVKMTSRARQVLDGELARVRVPPRPPSGWIKAVRQGLGLSGAQLARRMGVTAQSLHGLERSEADGSIRLSTLRRAADAMDCDVVYVLVPRDPDGLEGILRSRARQLAIAELAPVKHTMALEAQALPDRLDERMVDDITAELIADPRRLWAQS